MTDLNYAKISKRYGLLDSVYFGNKERSPRTKVLECIPDKEVKVVDLCCGTMSNSLGIAMNRKKATIIGLDLSQAMLQIAEQKLQEANIENAHVIVGDATNTGFEDNTFDYAILGLVLHETEEILSKRMLDETRRILKEHGRLLIVEWEQPRRLWKRLMFLIMKATEPKSFATFCKLDKQKYFEAHGFRTMRQFHCDYTIVMELEPIR